MPTVDTFLPEIIQSTFFSGYTIFNTVVYSLILVLFIIAIIKMFKKIEIYPESIIFSLIPFIIWGSSTRALVDNGIYPKTVFLITPGLYILVGLTTIASLLFCIYLYNRKDIDYRYSLFLCDFGNSQFDIDSTLEYSSNDLCFHCMADFHMHFHCHWICMGFIQGQDQSCHNFSSYVRCFFNFHSCRFFQLFRTACFIKCNIFTN